jgi:hypothetical protein
VPRFDVELMGKLMGKREVAAGSAAGTPCGDAVAPW